MPRGIRYPAEFKQEAVRLHHGSHKSLREIAEELGVAPATLRRWVVRIEVDAGRREGLTSEERIELRELRRKVNRLASFSRLMVVDPRSAGLSDRFSPPTSRAPIQSVSTMR